MGANGVEDAIAWTASPGEGAIAWTASPFDETPVSISVHNLRNPNSRLREGWRCEYRSNVISRAC
jgi:hypothetical protein